jgi:membrane protease YdiL (CAAX protease family)
MGGKSERPLTLPWALFWAVSAGAASFALQRAFAHFAPNTRTNFVTQSALVSIVLLLTTYAILLLHASEHPPRRALGIRPSAPSLVALGVGIGGLLPFAVGSLNALIEAKFPPSEQAQVVSQLLLSTTSSTRAIGLVVATSIVLPLVNELCFRGAIFGAMRRSGSLALATLGAAISPALARFDWHEWPAALLVGAFASHVRAASGSLLPALALHVGFGTVTTVSVISGTKLGGSASALVGWLGVAALGYAVQTVSRSNEDAEEARAEDAS